MDLKIFFDKVAKEVYEDSIDQRSFFYAIDVYINDLPQWDGADLAIIGITENRGSYQNEDVENAADALRKQLYRLKKGSGDYKIVDLGNLRCGLNEEESSLRLKEVCEILLEHNVRPIIIGGSHDMDYGQYRAYQKFNKLISIAVVDAFLDMEAEESATPAQSHLHKIITHEPNFLFNLTNLAFQSYLVDQQAVDVLEKLYFENYRVGKIQENIKEIEPVIRHADLLSFDISAIKIHDAPANPHAQPFGLTAQEACQICWYAGMNEKLSSAGFYEYNPDLDQNNITAKVVSTMIWYLIEGFYCRPFEADFASEHHVKYVVTLQNDPYKLTFFKSNISEKWWMEVPYNGVEEAKIRNSIVPCSYEDYLTASAGELPMRWINTNAKLL